MLLKWKSEVVIQNFICKPRRYRYGRWPWLWLAIGVAKIAAKWEGRFVIPKFYRADGYWELTEYSIYWAVRKVPATSSQILKKLKEFCLLSPVRPLQYRHTKGTNETSNAKCSGCGPFR
jgi:hypothetical protein